MQLLTFNHRFRGKGVYCQTAKLRHKTIDVQYNSNTIRVTTSVNYLECDKRDANITMLMSCQQLNILTDVTIGNLQCVFADQNSNDIQNANSVGLFKKRLIMGYLLL